jgi:hypothetical protein
MGHSWGPSSVQAVFDENGNWDATDNLVRAAISVNPLIEVVTIPGADHNIHRGEYDAFMAKVAPFITTL